MNAETVIVSSDNLSAAWGHAILHLIGPGVDETTPLVLTVQLKDSNTGFEREDVRKAFDNALVDLRARHPKLQLCNTVANTIFPYSMWNQSDPDPTKVFDRFEKAWPRIQRFALNRRGSYFRRMTAFRPRNGAKPVNQLKHVIDTYRGGNHRRSALQAAIFDPALDHNNSPRQLFPCLHQIAFTPIANDGLALTGFYATQYVFDRGYGNYLGLCRLGAFMAKLMGLRLMRMTCIASVAKLGTPKKSELAGLADQLKMLLATDERKT